MPSGIGSWRWREISGRFVASRAEQSGIGGLVRNPPNGRQAQIDRCRCVLFLFEIDSVSEDHGAIECEARFGTVPVDEIAYGGS
jgi:hypothetical protein